jgi:hypothetical protein
VDVVLERDRNAVERPAHAAGRPLAIERVGLLEGARVDREGGVQSVFVEREPHEVLLNELMRGETARLHGRLQVRDRRFDDGEGRTGGRGSAVLCGRYKRDEDDSNRGDDAE